MVDLYRKRVLFHDTFPDASNKELWGSLSLTSWAFSFDQDFHLGEDKTPTIHTESPCAFTTFPLYGALYRERGSLATEGKEVLALFEAIWLTQEGGHRPLQRIPKRAPQKSEATVADLATREVVLKQMELPQILMALLEPSVPGHPQYTPGYNWLGETRTSHTGEARMANAASGRPFLPTSLGHRSLPSHAPRDHKMTEPLRYRYYVRNLEILIKDITFKCATCVQVKPKMGRMTSQGTQAQGSGLGDTGRWTLWKQTYCFFL